MKVEIIRQFVDKHTRELYKPGMLIDFSEERIIEIQEKNAGLIKVIKEKTEPTEETEPEPTEETEPEPTEETEPEPTEETEPELSEKKVADATEKKKTKSKGKTK